MQPTKFTSALEASSYQGPDRGLAYEFLRKNVVETALAMGYDKQTMVECGVSWSDDHDPFKHVKNAAYPHYVNQCNFRVFESFEEQLGERFEDLMNTRHIGVMVKTYTINLKRPVKYPDSLLVANHITEVLPDRYFGITSMWSLRQQAIVADCKGYVVFFDYDKGVPANLLEAGGVYKDLYHALVQRKERESQIEKEWEAAHPKISKAKI
ncbi:hypothetical protein BGZ60DRAFT_392540 [Tricladium varicosporioides]|nr:hypothetical protein BGZ60DRAFT_392540 [Hymenoscyphus varicosporioides]